MAKQVSTAPRPASGGNSDVSKPPLVWRALKGTVSAAWKVAKVTIAVAGAKCILDAIGDAKRENDTVSLFGGEKGKADWVAGVKAFADNNSTIPVDRSCAGLAPADTSNSADDFEL